MAQEIVYPVDSLSTKVAIPREAVTIPKGKPSGPNARLNEAVGSIIRYPKSALIAGASCQVMVYGVVDSVGQFRIDSASLFQRQSTIVIGDAAAQVVEQEVNLGSVSEIEFLKKKVKIGEVPRKWSTAQRDMVRESLRVASLLPDFKPATIDGRVVASYFKLPVEFNNMGVWGF